MRDVVYNYTSHFLLFSGSTPGFFKLIFFIKGIIDRIMTFRTLMFILLYCYIPLSAIEDLAKPNEILSFWFGKETGEFPYEQSRLWFNSWFGTQDPEKNKSFDNAIKDLFESDIVVASENGYSAWETTPEGRLALILLLDQFPRHIYRGTLKAYSFDPKAEPIARRGVMNGDDQHLLYAQRLIFYLPFMHQENLENLEMGYALIEKLTHDVPQNLKPVFNKYLEAAKIYVDAMKTFGRFPWRNGLLGRESTPEEIIYLKNPIPHF